ncbi:MAG: outer membrane beta-barrel protein [Candidatus Solibacter sp.]|nr:outer membrane beta-barrel protein [Candidatus Solibacter sp.]
MPRRVQLDVKRIHQYVPLCLAMLLGMASANAQSGLDINVGVSGANARSTGERIETFGDGNFYRTPSLDGVFMNLGGGIMLSPRLGFGAEVTFKPRQSDYAGLGYRPIFYDFNGILHPLPGVKRVVPELQAGLGAVNLKYYYNQKDCNVFEGCPGANTLVQISNHFQLHAGASVSFFVTPHVYVRPQFDLHWVHNFVEFGSGLVPRYGVSVGYRFGAD